MTKSTVERLRDALQHLVGCAEDHCASKGALLSASLAAAKETLAATAYAQAPRGSQRCRQVGPHGFICTRSHRHRGLHAAHGSESDEPLATWPREATMAKAGGA